MNEITTIKADFSAERLIEAAITNKVDVSTMERLLAMRAQINAENAKRAYFHAMAALQAASPVIAKTKAVLNKDGKSTRYHYAPLDSILVQCREAIRDNGFSFRFESETADRTVKVTCIVTHQGGHSETASFVSQIDPEAFMNVQQRYGSALTFAKRYAFLNAFGLLTGDDDDDSQCTTAPSEHQKRLAHIQRLREARRQQQPIVNVGPEETDREPTHTEVDSPADDRHFLDFMASVSDASDAAEMTRIVEQSRGFEGPQKTAVQVAITKRAKALGLKWRTAEGCFAGA